MTLNRNLVKKNSGAISVHIISIDPSSPIPQEIQINDIDYITIADVFPHDGVRRLAGESKIYLKKAIGGLVQVGVVGTLDEIHAQIPSWRKS